MSQYCVYNTTLTKANYMAKIVSGDCPAVLWPSISCTIVNSLMELDRLFA